MLATCLHHNCILEYDPSTGCMECPMCKKAEYNTLDWAKNSEVSHD